MPTIVKESITTDRVDTKVKSNSHTDMSPLILLGGLVTGLAIYLSSEEEPSEAKPTDIDEDDLYPNTLYIKNGKDEVEANWELHDVKNQLLYDRILSTYLDIHETHGSYTYDSLRRIKWEDPTAYDMINRLEIKHLLEDLDHKRKSLPLGQKTIVTVSPRQIALIETHVKVYPLKCVFVNIDDLSKVTQALLLEFPILENYINCTDTQNSDTLVSLNKKESLEYLRKLHYAGVSIDDLESYIDNLWNWDTIVACREEIKKLKESSKS